MELELGLALPNTAPIKDFDLNDTLTSDYCYDHGTVRVDQEYCSTYNMPSLRCGRGGNESTNCNGRRRGGNRSSVVKVKKDGVAIARKVDLSLHNSYHSLFNTLYQMFPSMQHGEITNGVLFDDSWNYTIMYENENGDWMSLGSVSWEAFVWSVRRIKIFADQCNGLW